MRLDLVLDRGVRDPGPLDRADPRIKIVVTLAFVLVVVATPLASWKLFALECLALIFVAGFSGVSSRLLVSRWLGLLAVFGFLAVLAALAHPSRASLGFVQVAGSIVAKNSLALLAIVLLTQVTAFTTLLSALARIKVPAVLISTLLFMERYVHVLVEELDRMVKARRSRTFRRTGRLDWGILSGLLGVLFLRAWERGERVHAAMVSRGWDGVVRSLEFDGTGAR